LKEHNSGKNPSTKGFAPYELKYTETFENLDEALKREKFLKTGVGREFLDGIIK
jgi:putative endonuclease